MESDFPVRKFEGREEQLTLLEKELQATGDQPRSVFIEGQGGIGKSMLLNEYNNRIIKRHFRAQVAPFIDLADPSLRSLESIMWQIGEYDGYPKPVFDQYLRDSQSLQKITLQNPDRETLGLYQARVRQSFIKGIKDLSSREPLVLLFDSAEYVSGDNFWADVFNLIAELPHTVTVIAGRPEGIKAAVANAEQAKPQVVITGEELSPLDSQGANKMLDKLAFPVDPELRELIGALTANKPILLELSVYRLQRGLELPALDRIPKEKRNKGFIADEDLQMQFQAALVDFLFEPEGDLDKALLWLAFLNRRMDAEIHQALTGFPVDKSKDIVAELKSIPFIRVLGNYVVLHDEVVALVREHVWDRIDPFMTQRRKLSDRITEHLNERIPEIEAKREKLKELEKLGITSQPFGRQKRLETNLLRDLKYDRIDYRLRVEAPDWVDYYMSAYDSEDDSYYRNELDGLVRASGLREKLSIEERYELDVRRARLNRDMLNWQEAERLLEPWLNSSDLPAPLYIDAITAKVSFFQRQGQLLDAYQWIDKAIELATEEQPGALPYLQQTKGWISRQLGKFNDAVQLYEDAIRSLPRGTPSEKRSRAEVMNNLAFVHGIRGDPVSGFQWCQAALKVMEEFGEPVELAASYIVLGSLYWARELYGEARRQYDKAIELIDPEENQVAYARALFSYGIADWFAQEMQAADKHFSEAIAVMEENQIVPDLPLAIHNLGHVKLAQGEQDAAERHFQKGYELSKEYHNYYALADSLVGMVELYHGLARPAEARAYIQEMDDLQAQGYDFPLFAGRTKRIEAEIAFEQGELARAGKLFAQAMVMIGRHGGYSRYSLREELLRMTDYMNKLPKEQVLSWCNYLEQENEATTAEGARKEIAQLIDVRRAVE